MAESLLESGAEAVPSPLLNENDMIQARLHHEIYLTGARKVPPEKWKTVIRHPIRKIQEI